MSLLANPYATQHTLLKTAQQSFGRDMMTRMFKQNPDVVKEAVDGDDSSSKAHTPTYVVPKATKSAPKNVSQKN